MGKGGDEEFSRVHKRATWLNANVFTDAPINDEAIQAMYEVGVARAYELFKDVESKSEEVRNPSGYLISAARRDLGGGMALALHTPAQGKGKGKGKSASKGGGKERAEVAGADEFSKVHKRATWLNANVFPETPLTDEAIEAMFSLGIGRAFELFKEIEGKADTVRNPTGYLLTAARREGGGAGGALPPPPPAAPPAGRGSAKVRTVQWDDEFAKVHKRATWLNANVFVDDPISDAAIEAMYELGVSRAFEMFKDLEGKAANIKNSSGYLLAAARREGGGGGPPGPAPQGRQHGKGEGKGKASIADDDFAKVHRRATWLNANVFPEDPISEAAVEAMYELGVSRAFELFKDVESKAGNVKNSSGYLLAAARREGGGGGGGRAPAPSGGHGGGVGKGKGKGKWQPSPEEDFSKVHKRATWLNANVFVDKPMNDDTINAMYDLGVARAFELFKEIEGKVDSIRDPNGYLITAWKREEGGASVGSGSASGHGKGGGKSWGGHAGGGGGGPRVGGGAPAADDSYAKVHKRATWLNAHVFDANPIDEEAIEAVHGLGVSRAFELFKEIEAKAAEIRNPGGYLKTAARREAGGPVGRKRVLSEPPRPPAAKRAKGAGKAAY